MTIRNFPPTLGSSAVTSAPSLVPIQRARLTGSSQAANTRSRGTGRTRRITRGSAGSCVELKTDVLGSQPAAPPARRAARPRTRGSARATESFPGAARAGDGARPVPIRAGAGERLLPGSGRPGVSYLLGPRARHRPAQRGVQLPRSGAQGTGRGGPGALLGAAARRVRPLGGRRLASLLRLPQRLRRRPPHLGLSVV